MQKPVFTDRESARTLLLAKVADQQRLWDAMEAEKNLPASLRRHFATTHPKFLIRDAEWRLRWIDCAPEGANHQCAPLQDKTGTPMGGVYNENLGASQAVRDARVERGRDPISGQKVGA